MPDMMLKEETSTLMVLETDTSSRKWMEYLRMMIIPLLILAGIIIFVKPQTWVSWVITIIVIIIEAVMILVIYSEIKNVTVTIDFISQNAIRMEKFFFIRTKNIEMDLKQVGRVLIHCEEVGHHCRMLLESVNNKPFEIDFYLPTQEKQEASYIIAKKIGEHLRKPVVLEVTDQGNLISEEVIQN